MRGLVTWPSGFARQLLISIRRPYVRFEKLGSPAKSTGVGADAALTGVEYIIAKTITRPLVTLGTWNSNFHDHALEIATGRVKVLDMPAEDARKVAELVATTDGIIFHLWPAGDRIPTGTVSVGQAVGHHPLSAEEYARSGRRSSNKPN